MAKMTKGSPKISSVQMKVVQPSFKLTYILHSVVNK